VKYAAAAPNCPAAAVVTVKPSDWASGYKERPLVNVRLGLRLLGDADLTYALAIAKEMDERDPSNTKRNLMTATVATALCNPDDASVAHEAFAAPDELIRLALRPETIQALWDELERVMVETSPIREPATDESITVLMAAISEGALDNLSELDPARETRIRRYLQFCLDELIDAAEEPTLDAS